MHDADPLIRRAVAEVYASAPPTVRLDLMLESQGMRANQDITFLTDGGEEVRALTERISSCSEHVLDWFHITTRITVLGQFAKGVAQHGDKAGARLTKELARNTASLINYGERYRSGERISSAFVEAAVNAVVSKRFAKKQQMRWTRRGAHLLLQTRTKTLDGRCDRPSSAGIEAWLTKT